MQRPIDRLLAHLAPHPELCQMVFLLVAVFDAAEDLKSKIDLPSGFPALRLSRAMVEAEVGLFEESRLTAEEFWRQA